MITTNEIALDPKTFFRLLLRLNFRPKTRLLYGLAAALAIVWVVLYPGQKQVYLLLGAVLLFPLLTVFLTWRTAHNRMNRAFATPRNYTITETQVTARLAGGQEEVFDITRIRRLDRTRQYYLIFTSPVEFIYLPFTAFRNAADREWFESHFACKAKSHKRT